MCVVSMCVCARAYRREGGGEEITSLLIHKGKQGSSDVAH